MEGNDWIWPAIIVLAIFLWAVWTLRPMPPPEDKPSTRTPWPF